MNAGLLVFILLVVLAFIGLPIYMAIAIGTMVGLVSSGLPLEAMVQKTFLGLNSSSLLCIPFFVLAGNFMAKGITQKLINVANIVLGRVQGSLGCITVLASAMFGAISGSAVATVAAVGGITLPAMHKEGYDDNYAAALTSCASMLGPLVPPSISLIVYASLTEASVQKLFLATVTPAVLVTVFFIVYCLWYGKKANLSKQPKKSARESGKIILDSFWALLMPVVVLGAIFTGVCTAAEAAAVSCVYAAIVGLFVYKTISFQDLKDILFDSAISIATIMILVGFSKASSYVVIASQLPRAFMDALSAVTTNKYVILLILNIIFLILGCLMEGNSIIVMMVPLMLTLVKSLGIDLVHFGVLICMNLYIGCITPPVGVCLLLGTKIANTSVGSTFKAAIPFLFITLFFLALVTYWPEFTLWLPKLS